MGTPVVVTLSTIPVIIGGWFWGLRAGLLAGLLLSLLNILLVNLVKYPSWDVKELENLVRPGIVSLGLMLVGTVVGRLRDLSKEAKQQLAKRVQVEEKLKISEAKFRRLFENIPDGVYQSTPDGAVITVNPALVRMLGYDSEAEFLAIDVKRDLDIDPEVGKAWSQELMAKGELYNTELDLKRKDGSRVTVLENTRVVRDEGGRMLYYEGTLTDISERKKMEEELRFQKTLLESQNEATVEGILVVSNERKWLSFNRRFIELWGIADEVVRLKSSEAAVESVMDQLVDPQEFIEKIEYLYDHRDEESWDEVALKDRRIFERYSTPIRIEDGVYYGRVWYYRDITKRKRVEEILRWSEERYRQLVENANDLIYQTDAKGCFSFANYVAVRVTGYPEEEIIGKHYLDLVRPDYCKEVKRFYLKQFLKKISNTYYEFPAITKDGVEVWLGQNVQLIIEGDLIVGLQAVARDITKRVRVEDALRRSHEELEERVEGRTKELAKANEILQYEIGERVKTEDKLNKYTERLRSLSHRLVEVQETERRYIARELHDEIGQVLTGLKLSLETNRRLPAESATKSMDEAQAVVGELIGQVRDLSLDLRPAMLDDLGLLPSLLWHFERYSTRTDVKVTFDHTGLGRRFGPEVETTAYRIVQEALTNVARHSGANEAVVRLWVNQDDMLVLQVEDQGVGFDYETVLHSNKTSGISGMYERADLLGGQLTVGSSFGTGTYLAAQLPLDGLVEMKETTG